jgi:hypothetical protein
MWKKYFKVIKVRPGRIVTFSHGELDFNRDDIPVEICKELFEEDFPYLEITEEGKKELYGIEQVAELVEAKPIFEPLPAAEENPDELKTSIPIRKKYNKKSSE